MYYYGYNGLLFTVMAGLAGGVMDQDVFWGREAEVGLLRDWARQGSQLTVVYGRRRVGKTRLLEMAFSDARYLRVEGLEGLGQRDQKLVFCRAVARHFDEPAFLRRRDEDWLDLLEGLSSRLGRSPAVVILDEFPWLAGGRRTLVSKLKHVWDNHFAKDNCVHLVLCGSVSSFMVKKVLRSKALFGRVECELHLRPLPLPAVVPDLCRRRPLIDIAEIYMLVGGVPQYLRLFDYRKSPRLNLHERFFTDNAYFVNEFERLFASHFGSTPHYRSILEHLARHGPSDRDTLVRACNLGSGGRVSQYLENLIMADFVTKYGPVDRPSAGRNARYRISDPYLDFYLRFIRPNLNAIRSPGGRDIVGACLPQKRYYPWRGQAFERLCHEHRQLIAERLGFGAVAYQAGPWFRQGELGFQIDLVFLRADRVMTICGMKFPDAAKRVGKGVISEMQRKISRLPNPRGLAVDPVLITVSEPTRDLVNEGYFSRILTLHELFGA